MAQMEIVTLVCDLCGAEDGSGKGRRKVAVTEHTITVDSRKPRVIDACEGCWGPYADMVEKLIDAGRAAKRAMSGRSRLAKAS